MKDQTPIIFLHRFASDASSCPLTLIREKRKHQRHNLVFPLLLESFLVIEKPNPFSNKHLQFAQPTGHAQLSLAKFGHCGIWCYDLSLGPFFGGRRGVFCCRENCLLKAWIRDHTTAVISCPFFLLFSSFKNFEKRLKICLVSPEIDHIAISKARTQASVRPSDGAKGLGGLWTVRDMLAGGRASIEVAVFTDLPTNGCFQK